MPSSLFQLLRDVLELYLALHFIWMLSSLFQLLRDVLELYFSFLIFVHFRRLVIGWRPEMIAKYVRFILEHLNADPHFQTIEGLTV